MPEIIPNLHPLLVHFPIALISVAALAFPIARALHGESARACTMLGHMTLWLGALSALPAAALGWHAFNSVDHDDAGHAAMLLHRAWALGTLGLLALLAGWDIWRSKVDALPAPWFASAVLGAWVMVAVTAWHGGELVYRHGLGVLALPDAHAGQQEDHAHDHEHATHAHDEASTGGR